MIPPTAEEMPAPVLTVNPNKDVFATNDTFTLICTPSDPVYSFVTFYHDNWKVSRQSTELVVQDVNPDYTGNYTCTVQYSGTGPSPKSNIVSLVVEGKLPIAISFSISAEYIYMYIFTMYFSSVWLSWFPKYFFPYKCWIFNEGRIWKIIYK